LREMGHDGEHEQEHEQEQGQGQGQLSPLDKAAMFFNAHVVNPRVLWPNLKLVMNITLFAGSVFVAREYGYLLAA